jgi:hypothetical protein
LVAFAGQVEAVQFQYVFFIIDDQDALFGHAGSSLFRFDLD